MADQYPSLELLAARQAHREAAKEHGPSSKEARAAGAVRAGLEQAERRSAAPVAGGGAAMVARALAERSASAAARAAIVAEAMPAVARKKTKKPQR